MHLLCMGKEMYEYEASVQHCLHSNANDSTQTLLCALPVQPCSA